MRAIRGAEIGLVFQEPMTSFSPVHTIGNQIIEAVRLHCSVNKHEARERAIEVLRQVGIPKPERRIDEYAFELSGGLRQRAMIAVALSCDPRLLIADEPTTALDVTTQAQILDLLRQLQQQRGMAIMLITHNLGVIAEMADDVVVMYLGRVVEEGPVDDLFHAPKHPYTQALLRSIPSIESTPRVKLPTISGSIPHPYNRPSGCPFYPRCPDFMPGMCDQQEPDLLPVGERQKVSCFLYVMHKGSEARSKVNDSNGQVLLDVKNLRKFFPIRKGFLQKVVGHVRAVDDVTFYINQGETLSLVGESGCGKTTTSRCILRAIDPTAGQILFRADDDTVVDVAALPESKVQRLRCKMQMIFQDPFSSLNPRMTLLDIVGEPLLVNGMTNRQQRMDRVAELLRLVGLRPEYMRRYPHAFSGGQRQRIGIARALALNPCLVVADEPVSALDVSVQAQILNLLLELQAQTGPDLSVCRARPERRQAYQRARGRDVCRQDRRDGQDG